MTWPSPPAPDTHSEGLDPDTVALLRGALTMGATTHDVGATTRDVIVLPHGDQLACWKRRQGYATTGADHAPHLEWQWYEYNGAHVAGPARRLSVSQHRPEPALP